MGVVSILTHSFTDGYNREFGRVFGGGLERYILDLCSVIRGLGHIPEVHQLSYFEAFQTRTEQIDVFGYSYDMDNVPEAFDRMAAAARGPVIYASCLWQPITYKPGSLGICHGINWDPDLIQDGFNGLLVPPGEQELTAALVRLVQDRAERERLGIYARETALSYDLARWRSRWSTVLESFLAETGLKEGIRG